MQIEIKEILTGTQLFDALNILRDMGRLDVPLNEDGFDGQPISLSLAACGSAIVLEIQKETD